MSPSISRRLLDLYLVPPTLVTFFAGTRVGLSRVRALELSAQQPYLYAGINPQFPCTRSRSKDHWYA